jgi:uncharacterized ubiquitin-like protein YukD
MNTEVVSREELEEDITAIMQSKKVNIKENEIFIAGVTKAKAYSGIRKMCIEIVQARTLPIHEVNLTTTILTHDDRYLGEILSDVRVNVEFTVKGFDSVFSALTTQTDVNKKLTGAELYEKTKNLNDNEILSVFTRIKTITVNEQIVFPTISMKQYSLKRGLPQIITTILDTEETNRTINQIEELTSMTLVNKENECMVDLYRNQVYQIKEFTHYGHNSDDIGVPIKMPISKHYDYIFDMNAIHSNQLQNDICKTISGSESMLWTSELIERYSDKWDWNALSKNDSVPWTLNLINKYAAKLSCSESIWNTLKPYIDDELIEEVLKIKEAPINKEN